MKKLTKPAREKRKRCKRLVYALVNKVPGTIYVLSIITTDPKELWRAVIKEEFMGAGHTKETLKAQGWSAKRVTILI